MIRPLRSILVWLFVSAALAPLALGAPTGPQARIAAPRLVLAGSQFGRVLFDGNRRALYAFTRDPRGRSACTGECAAKWPPYVVRGRVGAGPGIRPSLIGTTRRGDGRLQVLYRGRPLYFYAQDKASGDTKGQNVGGIWFVVKP